MSNWTHAMCSKLEGTYEPVPFTFAGSAAECVLAYLKKKGNLEDQEWTRVEVFGGTPAAVVVIETCANGPDSPRFWRELRWSGQVGRAWAS